MLLELCVENYKTCDGLMNGVNENFNIILKNISKYLMWTLFHYL
jgi:hypothetical protein